MDGVDFLEIPERNPLFSGDISGESASGTLVGNAGSDAMADTSIWDQIGDFTRGIGGVVSTGFDVFNDVTGRDDDPGPVPMSPQTMLLLLGGLALVAIILTRR